MPADRRCFFVVAGCPLCAPAGMSALAAALAAEASTGEAATWACGLLMMTPSEYDTLILVSEAAARLYGRGGFRLHRLRITGWSAGFPFRNDVSRRWRRHLVCCRCGRDWSSRAASLELGWRRRLPGVPGAAAPRLARMGEIAFVRRFRPQATRFEFSRRLLAHSPREPWKALVIDSARSRR